MAYKQPSLDQLKQAIRTGICSTCPYRQKQIAGEGMRRTCEDACPLFVSLPILKARAEQLEPMVGRHEQVLNGLMQELAQVQEKRPQKAAESARNALRRHRRRASQILARLTSV